MERKDFTVTIAAPVARVWDTLFGVETYPQWTAVFCEGSHVKTDWQEGSKAVFLDGKNNGMVSVIAENRPNEFMSIKHIGEVVNGVEDTESDKVKAWAGAEENYTLSEQGGTTTLTATVDLDAQYVDFFMRVFPQALNKVKEIAEGE